MLVHCLVETETSPIGDAVHAMHVRSGQAFDCGLANRYRYRTSCRQDNKDAGLRLVSALCSLFLPDACDVMVVLSRFARWCAFECSPFQTPR